MDPIVLPIISVQNDFQNVIKDVNDGIILSENIWVSCYRVGSPSVHGKVNIALGQQSRSLELISDGNITFERGENGGFRASCEALSVPSTIIRIPKYSFQETDSSIRSKQVTSIAVAPDHAQIAIGYASGAVRRLALDSRATPLIYTPHLSGSAVTSITYFPSSRVLLTGGADFTLHVLNAELEFTSTVAPKPVRSLKGHRRSVTGIAIIERGRNVVSSALDGTLRLWDVSNGQQIRLAGSQSYSSINSIALVSSSSNASNGSMNGSNSAPQGTEATSGDATQEIGTKDKYVFLALQDGNFECIELTSGISVFHSSSLPNYTKHGAITSLTVIQDDEYDPTCNLLALGTSSGVVAIYDIQSLFSPLYRCCFRRNTANIEGLAFITPSNGSSEASHTSGGKKVQLTVATSDGLPYIAQISLSVPENANEPEVEVYAELAGGGDCEPNRTIFVDSLNNVWVAGDDGVVRMY